MQVIKFDSQGSKFDLDYMAWNILVKLANLMLCIEIKVMLFLECLMFYLNNLYFILDKRAIFFMFSIITLRTFKTFIITNFPYKGQEKNIISNIPL